MGNAKSSSSSSSSSVSGGTNANPSHLVVLAHGLNGEADNLAFLHRKLEALSSGDCLVLASEVNEGKTTMGVMHGGILLSMDVKSTIEKNPSLKRISFVGNSLGGLYVRICAKELFDPSSGTFGGLEGCQFVTIASPWLGVLHHTYWELPKWLAGPIVMLPNGQTGRDLFYADNYSASTSATAAAIDSQGVELEDASATASGRRISAQSSHSIKQTLLYSMATDEAFLAPLRLFRKRRVYANLVGDFMVQLRTAAIMTREEEARVLAVFKNRVVLNPSIACILDTEDARTAPLVHPSSSLTDPIREGTTGTGMDDNELDPLIHSLNSLGLSKVLVYFPDKLPVNHNKICCLESSNPLKKAVAFQSKVEDGEFVMNHLASFVVHGEDI